MCAVMYVRTILLRRVLRTHFSTSATTRNKSHLSQNLPKTIRDYLLFENTNSLEQPTIQGWVQSVRKMKNVCFATINDGSTTKSLQVVLDAEQIQGLTIGAAVRISGSWKEAVEGEKQQLELLAEKVDVIGQSDPGTYPLQKKSHSPEYLRSIPHLRSRASQAKAILHLRSFCISHLQQYFRNNGFIQTHPPILTSSDCEGAGEVFQVMQSDSKPFFRRPTYLTVSTQLHLEALALSVGRVWTLSPTFRAEKSDTARHLNEFYMLEAELAFIDDLETIMAFVEDMIKSLINAIVSDNVSEENLSIRREGLAIAADVLKVRWSSLTSSNWSRISYTDAIDLLTKAVDNGSCAFKYPVIWGHNLQSEHEKYIAEAVGNGGGVFVTNYPKHLKPFYMLPTTLCSNAETDRYDGETVACFDLLLPKIGEIVGGSMREHRLEPLRDTMQKQAQLRGNTANSEEQDGPLSWYLDLRKWGSVPHGGFGLGFDRLLTYIAGIDNIRESVTYPRWYDRVQC